MSIDMSAAEHLARYAGGWIKGDADTILKATAEDYTFDDPNAGVVSRNAFASYMEELKDAITLFCGGALQDPFMEISEVVSQETGGVLTAWRWWSITGTDIKGSGLIKADAGGVRSEVITYYTSLPG
jgi:hypothetical protein